MTVSEGSADQALVRVVSRSEDVVAPRLIVSVRLSQACEDLVNDASPKRMTALALVDTGATKTCVCKTLLDRIGAEPWDKVAQIGVGGIRDCYIHYTDIALLDHDDVEFAAFSSIKVIDFGPTNLTTFKSYSAWTFWGNLRKSVYVVLSLTSASFLRFVRWGPFFTHAECRDCH